MRDMGYYVIKQPGEHAEVVEAGTFGEGRTYASWAESHLGKGTPDYDRLCLRAGKLNALVFYNDPHKDLTRNVRLTDAIGFLGPAQIYSGTIIVAAMTEHYGSREFTRDEAMWVAGHLDASACERHPS